MIFAEHPFYLMFMLVLSPTALPLSVPNTALILQSQQTLRDLYRPLSFW